MAQDPAFLFYTNDFERGVQFFSDEQVGKYLRLLMAQHQHGHLSEKQMIHICKSYDEDVFCKFEKDDGGLFYNQRLDIEIARRKKWVDSRSSNKSGKIKELQKDKPKIISKSYDNHMEIENEIENEGVGEKKEKKSEKAKKATQEVFDVVEHLNIRSGRKFNPQRQQTANLVISRLKEGYTVEDLKKIIDCKVEKWGNDEKMRQFLRPETLFAPSKIDGYLQDANDPKITKPQNGHDPRYSATFVKDKA